VILDFLAEKEVTPALFLKDTLREVLQAVQDGESDCAVVPRVSALYLMEKNDWPDLVLGNTGIFTGKYAYAVKNGQSALLAQFSEGLALVEQTGEYHRIQNQWLGRYQEKTLSLVRALKFLAMVVIPLVLVLLAMALWSRTLRRQVALKTRELHDSSEFQRAMIACSPVALYSVDMSGNVIEWNDSAQKMFGWTAEEVMGQRLPIVPEDSRHEFEEMQQQVLEKGVITGLERVRRKKDGTLLDIRLSLSSIHDFQGRVMGVMGAVEDITREKQEEAAREKLQSQLLQAQKMESVGRLAGGVAHDFNNMLNVIIGYAELGQLKTEPDSSLHADLQEIQNAARRSSDITRQLLAFARKQTIQPKALDLNAVIEVSLKMLRRLIGENITLFWHPGSNLRSVYMDASQVDQILANLLVNARDAIDGIGKVTIETRNIRVDEQYCSVHEGFMPGEFVMLAVSDNGTGMDRHTRENLFEPFFSTKQKGKGTGLGLATVYGIVKQNNGFIHVYSEPGSGATFKIYLPCHEEPARAEVLNDEVPVPSARGETLLVVEDEKAILTLAEKVLENLGYHVIASLDPEEALDRIQRHDGEVHLLLTDVVMPNMNGRDLAEQVRKHYPDIRVLFMSGYTANVIAHHGILDTGVNFIQKPFSGRDLAVRIRAILDEGGQ
jgi:two-component system sensor histidine kinase EvgS